VDSAELGAIAARSELVPGSRALAAFGNVVLALYAADGVLSLGEHVLQAATDSTVLDSPRDILARVTLFALATVWSVLAVTPQLPKRVFAAPLLVSAWWALGAPPVPLLVTSARAFDLLGIACQLASAALAFLLVRAAYGRYRLDPRQFVGPAFRLRSSAGFVAAHLLLVPPLLAASALFDAAAQIERATAGFVTFHGHEIRIHQRRYLRGDREVRLVGMMHLGEAESYRELFLGFRGPSTVVLEEGVSDLDGLLHQPLSYSGVANALGLSAQPDVEGVLEEAPEAESEETPDVRNADLDLRDFHPETITVLDALASVWSAGSPGEAVGLLRKFAQRGDAASLLSIANQDILERRNRHLLEEIRLALDTHQRVIVPWGALHLAAIEAGLKAEGFVQQDESSRTLLRYATVVQAARRALRRDRPRAGIESSGGGAVEQR